MELKSKALKDFWIWYLLPENKKEYKTGSLWAGDSAIKVRFLSLSFTERYGVYVDFFDSFGINLEVCKYIIGDVFGIMINGDMYDTHDNEFKTRQEARSEAIKQANEIYNKL